METTRSQDESVLGTNRGAGLSDRVNGNVGPSEERVFNAIAKRADAEGL
ncbi:MAG: hypothetical protein AAFQ89_17930 [Cyanobacteria bacterium J06626_18]